MRNLPITDGQPTRRNNRQLGLTIIEVLIVVATLCLLISLLLPSVGKNAVKAPLTACGSNLKQVTLGELIWASDQNSSNVLPGQLSTNFGGFRESLLQRNLSEYYRSLSNEFTAARILTCPSDSRKPTDDFASLTTNHLSYFLNMDAKSGAEAPTLLHGDRHIVFIPASRDQLILVTTNTLMTWDRTKGHRTIGNLAFSDGSIAKANDRDLRESLVPPSDPSAQRLLVP